MCTHQCRRALALEVEPSSARNCARLRTYTGRRGGGANEEDEKGEDEEGGADKSHGIQMMEMVLANRGVVESAASCRVAIAEVVTQPQASGDSPSRANRRYSTADPDEGPVGDENMKSKSTRRYSTT